MALLVTVGRHGSTAVRGVRARETDGFHKALHGVAPAVVVARRGAALVALAGVLELVAARRTHNMSDVALQTHM